MADQSQALIVHALTRALAAPDGLPLFGKTGLFATSAAGRQAAQACRARGLVRVLRDECKGKTTQEIVSLAEEGVAFLLHETNPRPLLEAILQAAQQRQGQLDELLETARATRAAVAELHGHARRVFDHLGFAKEPIKPAERNGKHLPEYDAAIATHLDRWNERGVLEDCPLPELFRALHPAATIGQFHDSLRRLQESRQILLHPWTGPLYEIPEPALALLVGHEIAYYASKSC